MYEYTTCRSSFCSKRLPENDLMPDANFLLTVQMVAGPTIGV